MKKSKKLLALLILVTTVLTLSACGKKPAEEGNIDFEGKTLTIGVWGGNDAEEASLQKLIDTFEEQTKAKIETKVYTDYNTQIQADLVGKTAPDVFYVDASMYPFFAAQGALMELDKEAMQADKFFDTLIDTFSTEGKLYAMPKDFSTLSLYLNTDVFEKAGVDVSEMPSSFEELVTWLPEFQSKIDAAYGEGKVLAMSYNPEMARNMHLAQRGGADITDKEGLANLTDPKVVENLQILMDLVGTKAFVTPQDLGTGWNGEAFGTGKLAIMDEGNWVYETLKTEYTDINFTVKEMPTYKGEKGSMMFTVGWGKYAGTENSELADEWVKYVTGEEGMKTWAVGTGTLPSRQDVAEAAKVTENEDLNVHLEAWEFATPWQKDVTLTTVDNAYKNFIVEALNGKMSLEDALTKAQEQANEDIEASR